MLYSRSSFLRYLTKVHDCEVTPLEGRVLRLKNGPAFDYMITNRHDRIDYEEISMLCAKLYIPLPGDKDLVLLE